MKGQETFRMASPIFRKNLYVGVFERFDKNNSPLDFFNIDQSKYPYAASVKFIDAKLNAGDCVYIPAYYYIQSKTTGADNHFGSIILI